MEGAGPKNGALKVIAFDKENIVPARGNVSGSKSSKSHLRDLQGALQRKAERSDEYKAALLDLKERYEILWHNSEQKEAELENLRESVASLDNSSRELRQENESLHAALSERESHVSALLAQQAAEDLQRRTHLEGQVDAAMASEATSAATVATALANERESLRSWLTELEATAAGLDRQVQDRDARIAALENDLRATVAAAAAASLRGGLPESEVWQRRCEQAVEARRAAERRLADVGALEASFAQLSEQQAALAGAWQSACARLRSHVHPAPVVDPAGDSDDGAATVSFAGDTSSPSWDSTDAMDDGRALRCGNIEVTAMTAAAMAAAAAVPSATAATEEAESVGLVAAMVEGLVARVCDRSTCRGDAEEARRPAAAAVAVATRQAELEVESGARAESLAAFDRLAAEMAELRHFGVHEVNVHRSEADALRVKAAALQRELAARDAELIRAQKARQVAAADATAVRVEAAAAGSAAAVAAAELQERLRAEEAARRRLEVTLELSEMALAATATAADADATPAEAQEPAGESAPSPLHAARALRPEDAAGRARETSVARSAICAPAVADVAAQTDCGAAELGGHEPWGALAPLVVDARARASAEDAAAEARALAAEKAVLEEQLAALVRAGDGAGGSSGDGDSTRTASGAAGAADEAKRRQQLEREVSRLGALLEGEREKAARARTADLMVRKFLLQRLQPPDTARPPPLGWAAIAGSIATGAPEMGSVPGGRDVEEAALS